MIEWRPIWEKCGCCDEYLCHLHKCHTHDNECICPPIDEWQDDPYTIKIPVDAEQIMRRL